MYEKTNRPKIGLLSVGHHYYWDQFPRLKEMGQSMCEKLRNTLGEFSDILEPELVDSPEKSKKAGEIFREQGIDILIIFPLGYTPSLNVIPAVNEIDVPIRILNAHEDRSYNYTDADTTIYLHHEGVCCVPEFAGALVNMGRKFKVLTGFFDEARLRNELLSEALGASAAVTFRSMNFGLIGQIYTNMIDMPIDEHRLVRATGKLLQRPEVEEIENAFNQTTESQIENMCREFREMYNVEENVTNEHLRFSARLAVAYDKIITKYNIYAFGYYWWGEKELITQLRSQSGLAVSRLASLGRPGVTEGDVKSAMAMKIIDLLGGGGMFLEFFSMDFNENFFLMGHDGPSNINMSKGKPKVMHLKVHHGKSGHGLGIDFEIEKGPVTLLNLTQFYEGNTFKLIYSVGEVIPGPILNIGNPNCRVRVQKPLHEFMDAWCQQGPSHHIALGRGDLSISLEAFAEAMEFHIVRV
jgi:L-arabinose isomerase